MIPIKNNRPIKIGNSHYFLIPAQYINNEVIKITDNFDIDIHIKKSKH